MALQLGGSLPLHVGAGPRVLLAAADDEFVEPYIAQRPLTRFTEHTITAPDDLRADVAATRANAYAISDEDDVLGMAAVGAPIRDHEGRITATLSLSGPKPTVLEAETENSLRLIRDAAGEVSGTLGHGHPAAGPERTSLSACWTACPHSGTFAPTAPGRGGLDGRRSGRTGRARDGSQLGHRRRVRRRARPAGRAGDASPAATPVAWTRRCGPPARPIAARR